MDGTKQAQAYAEADFEDVNQGLVDRFRELFPSWRGRRILDMGCGPADIPARLCAAFPEASVFGIDASAAMLALAREAVREGGLEDRISLLRAYVPQIPFEQRAFDAIVSNSLLHHLSDPLNLWRTCKRYGRPGSPVLVCDLFRPPSQGEARKIVDDAGCSDHPALQADFYNSLLAAYRIEEITQQLEDVGLDHLDVEMVSERHILVWGHL